MRIINYQMELNGDSNLSIDYERSFKMNEIDLKNKKLIEAEIKKMWLDFGDVPMDPETEELEYDWCEFIAGTHREDIWHWFEEKYNISVVDLLYHFDEFELK